eukprot:CAMPEP_0181316682 /NCGR_PEP_ID=MMETSP1101-20121128/16028_1 /TAXON_ID=46948 /ORGANISM="Rhodomonas abbreviata, Strain Caron Lab Isolate" /LENGTH=369 /DNA_ID=CAMNT_0023423951 /DNA_START=57 /DNA_END=1166 /DNA_ORIENTATION=+
MGILGLPSAAVFPFDGQAGPGVSFALRAQPLSRSTSRPSGCFLRGPLVSPGSALPVGGSDCRFCDCFSFGWAGSAGDFLCAQAQPLSWLRSRPSGCLLCTPLISPGVFPACQRDDSCFLSPSSPGDGDGESGDPGVFGAARSSCGLVRARWGFLPAPGAGSASQAAAVAALADPILDPGSPALSARAGVSSLQAASASVCFALAPTLLQGCVLPELALSVGGSVPPFSPVAFPFECRVSLLTLCSPQAVGSEGSEVGGEGLSALGELPGRPNTRLPSFLKESTAWGSLFFPPLSGGIAGPLWTGEGLQALGRAPLCPLSRLPAPLWCSPDWGFWFPSSLRRGEVWGGRHAKALGGSPPSATDAACTVSG